MLRFRTVTLALCVLIFFVFGCTGTQGGKNAMKSTGAIYNKHINKPARLEFDESNPLKAHQKTLVEAVAPVDFELEELLKVMDDSDRSPDEEWAEALIKRFPWVKGIFMADGRGRIMTRIPSSSVALPDFAPLLNMDEKQRPTDLRAAVMPGADGPEIYLAKPVYLQSELRVIIVCHFDVRSLLARHGEPEKFVMLSGNTPLWAGVYTFSETPLNNVDWDKLALQKIDGRLKNEKGEFYWLASFFANIQLVYATPVNGDFSVNPQQMNVLKSPRFAGAGM